MKILCVILVLVQVFLDVESLNFRMGKQGTRQATFERFDNTCGDRNVLIIFNYEDMKSEGSKLIFNSTISVKEDILMELRVIIYIERCRNKENLDTCEHFYDHKVEDYCGMIGSDNTMWSPMFAAYVPRFKCPVKKGIYRATKNVLDTSALLMFPFESWYWKTKIHIRDKATGRMVSCTIVETHISTA